MVHIVETRILGVTDDRRDYPEIYTTQEIDLTGRRDKEMSLLSLQSTRLTVFRKLISHVVSEGVPLFLRLTVSRCQF